MSKDDHGSSPGHLTSAARRQRFPGLLVSFTALEAGTRRSVEDSRRCAGVTDIKPKRSKNESQKQDRESDMAQETTGFKSRVFEVEDITEAFELGYERGWTDGLPIIPATDGKVADMLAYVGRDPQEAVGTIPPGNGIATLEKVAINCVMAGCLPQYLPAVLAALKAMLNPGFNLNGVEATQSPCEPLLVFGGPIVKELGFNYDDGVFGGASRANATIGRAIRLILWNIGGSVPGKLAKAPLSHPGRYSYCVAEQQEGNPWEPLQVEAGLPADVSAVSVIAATAPIHLHLGGSEAIIESAQEILIPYAEALSFIGGSQMVFLSEALVILGPHAAGFLANLGWSKDSVRLFLFEHARRRIGDMAKRYFYNRSTGNTRWPKWIDQTNDDTMVPCVTDAKKIHILVTGGARGKAICPGWHFSSMQAATV